MPRTNLSFPEKHWAHKPATIHCRNFPVWSFPNTHSSARIKHTPHVALSLFTARTAPKHLRCRIVLKTREKDARNFPLLRPAANFSRSHIFPPSGKSAGRQSQCEPLSEANAGEGELDLSAQRIYSESRRGAWLCGLLRSSEALRWRVPNNHPERGMTYGIPTGRGCAGELRAGSAD